MAWSRWRRISRRGGRIDELRETIALRTKPSLASACEYRRCSVGGWKEGYRETWVPVDPVTFENGAMQYWRGSHRDGKLYKPNVFISQSPLPGSEGHDLPDIENNMDDFDIIHFDVQPGDVLVHHYRTIHGTGGNRSRYQVRRAASIRYCVGIARNEYHRNEMHLSKPLSQSDALVFAR